MTVIDYYSRYLLACYLTSSYSAIEAQHGLKLAREEAERLHGPLKKRLFLVTDSGTSFSEKRFQSFVRESYQHVRIQYRTPQQLGLLERFHGILKREEVYWRMYDNPVHARKCLKEFRQRYNQSRPHRPWFLRKEEIPTSRQKSTPASDRSRFSAGRPGPEPLASLEEMKAA